MKSTAGLVAAAFAGIGSMLVVGRILPLAVWYGEAVSSSVGAAAWMLAGLHVAPRSRLVGAGLFASGSVLMWWGSRGVVHSVSPYYGLAPFGLSIIAAGSAWLWFEAKHSGHKWDPTILSAVVIISFVGRSLWSEVPGVGRTLRLGDGTEFQVGFANASDGASFIWTPSSLEKIPPGSAIELDPGSGFVTSLRFVPILDDEKRSEVCAVFEKQDREKLATEIQRQMTPQIAGALPPGGRACRSGSVWNLVPEEGS